MPSRIPLVLGDDGALQQLQAGDRLSTQAALAVVFQQNVSILKMLIPMYLQHVENYGDASLTPQDLEDVIGELL